MPNLMPILQRSVRHQPVLRHVSVSAVRRVTARIVRVTLAGPELDGFVALGPADHIKVFLPDPVTGEPVTPAPGPAPLTIGSARGSGAPGSVVPGAGGAPRPAPAVVSRDYTPLAYRPADGVGRPELDVDFVVHGDEGPASAWAGKAGPGDRLAIAGPRGSRLVPEGIDELLLVVDETAFPAASRWLRLAPPQVPVTLILDVADRDARAYFDGVPGADQASFVVAYRGGDGGELERAVRGLSPFGAGTYIFLAGEATGLVPLRRYLRRELGLPPEQMWASGYWKRGVAALDHHAPLDPDDPD